MTEKEEVITKYSLHSLHKVQPGNSFWSNIYHFTPSNEYNTDNRHGTVLPVLIQGTWVTACSDVSLCAHTDSDLGIFCLYIVPVEHFYCMHPNVLITELPPQKRRPCPEPISYFSGPEISLGLLIVHVYRSMLYSFWLLVKLQAYLGRERW